MNKRKIINHRCFKLGASRPKGQAKTYLDGLFRLNLLQGSITARVNVRVKKYVSHMQELEGYYTPFATSVCLIHIRPKQNKRYIGQIMNPSKHGIEWWLEIIRWPEILLPKKPQLIPATNRKQHNVQYTQISNEGEYNNAGRYYIIKR